MNTINLKYFAEVQINSNNCDEIISESFEILKQATKIKTIRDADKMRSQYLSRQIKRGLAAKRELNRNHNVSRGVGR